MEVDDAARMKSAWWLNPYLHLVLNGLLVTGGQLLMKRGAEMTAQVAVPSWLGWLGIASLGSWWVWGGISAQILGFLNWLYVLRWIPLSTAFPLVSAVHVLIPLGAWVFLGESISIGRWLGIALIIAGIWVIAKPLVQAEAAL